MYAWPELLHLWEHEQLTEAQVIGQLLRYGEAHEATLTAQQRRQDSLEQLVITLTTRVAALGAGRPKRPAA